MPPTKKIDLNIEVDVLTAGSTADIVNAILEFLLFQRNQIPFVYSTYKYYVGLWAEESESGAEDGKEIRGKEGTSASTLTNYQLDRQRKQAFETKKAISTMREVIKNSFENNLVCCLRFIFGSTTFTAKEAYTIHIPTDSISRRHFHNQHLIPHARLNNTLISLLTSEDLYNIFSHNLCPTNLYLELEMLTQPGLLKETNTNAQLLPKDLSQLPPSCKDIHIHLQHSPYPLVNDSRTLNCCKELEIFGGIMNLNIKDDQRNEFIKKEERLMTPAWWEADILVRGFKEKPVKGLNMWTK